jgi:hypothetical protein
MAPKLITCGAHKYAPWCAVCMHPCDGTAKEAGRVPMGDGCQDDWLCPDCFRKGPDRIEIEDIRCVCIHGARDLTGAFGRYESLGPRDLKPIKQATQGTSERRPG